MSSRMEGTDSVLFSLAAQLDATLVAAKGVARPAAEVRALLLACRACAKRCEAALIAGILRLPRIALLRILGACKSSDLVAFAPCCPATAMNSFMNEAATSALESFGPEVANLALSLPPLRRLHWLENAGVAAARWGERRGVSVSWPRFDPHTEHLRACWVEAIVRSPCTDPNRAASLLSLVSAHRSNVHFPRLSVGCLAWLADSMGQLSEQTLDSLDTLSREELQYCQCSVGWLDPCGDGACTAYLRQPGLEPLLRGLMARKSLLVGGMHESTLQLQLNLGSVLSAASNLLPDPDHANRLYAKLGTARENGAEELLRTGAGAAREANLTVLERRFELSLATCLVQCGKTSEAHVVLLNVLMNLRRAAVFSDDHFNEIHELMSTLRLKLETEGHLFKAAALLEAFAMAARAGSYQLREMEH